MNKRRPIEIVALCSMAGIFALWNALRFGNALAFWTTLAGYGRTPLYLALTGAVWLVAGLVDVVGLWFGKHWGQLMTLLLAGLYLLWYWFDRLLLQQPHANWPFALVCTFLGCLFTLVLLFSPRTRDFLR